MKTNYAKNFDKERIQTDANGILESMLRQINSETLHWTVTNEETQKDKGVDYQVEIQDYQSGATHFIFKIQNKGTRKIRILKKGDDAGFISFQVKTRHIKYFRNEINIGLLFIVVDVTNNKIFWHPIQLDESIDELVQTAKIKKKASISIRLNPQKQLNPANFYSFIDDAKNSNTVQSERHFAYINRKAINPVVKELPGRHMLDKVYDLLLELKSDFGFIPPEYLAQHYLFGENNYRASYTHYTLYCSNIEFIKLLDKVEIVSGQISVSDESYFHEVENLSKKLDFVIKTLNESLIFNVRSMSGGKTLRIYHNDVPRSYLYELHQKLKISELINAINDNTLKTEERAYLSYKTGFLKKSLSLYESALKEAKNRNIRPKQFTLGYSIQSLKRLINIIDFSISRQENSAIDNLYLNTIPKLALGSNVEWFYKFIAERDFINGATFKVLEYTNKVINQHNNGGWSSIPYSSSLINHYSRLIFFLNLNNIVYDFYSEFRRVTDTFIEGIFAAFKTKNSVGGYLEYLDDWTTYLLVHYGDPKQIIRVYNRYNSELIPYRSTAEKGDTFLDMVENFFSFDTKKINVADDDTFFDFYQQTGSNLLILLAICDISEKAFNDIFPKIITHFKYCQWADGSTVGYFKSLLIKKGSIMSVENLQDFVDLIASDHRFHNRELIDKVHYAVNVKSLPRSTLNSLSKLIDIHFDYCLTCKTTHVKSLPFNLFKELPDELKRIVAQKIGVELKGKFSSDLYYHALIYDFVKFNPKEWSLFLQKTIPQTINQRRTNVFDQESETYQLWVGEIVNTCFKFGIDVKSVDFPEKIYSIPYYNWLTNLDTFNYSEWEPKWLLTFDTVYYRKVFSRNKTLKKMLESYLLDNPNPQLERHYFNLYARNYDSSK